MPGMHLPDFEDRLRTYAELLVRLGVNLQPGQKLILRTSLEAAPLARKVAEAAYRAGSPYVADLWGDMAMARTRFLHGPEGTFEIFSPEFPALMNRMAGEGAASLALVSDDPDGLAGVDPARIAAYQRAFSPAVQPYREATMSDRIPWSIGAAAAPAWAMKVFPHLPEEDAVAALWEAIFAAVRLTEPDPVAAWREHNDGLARRRDRLNERRYAALRFKGPGTDLRVGLPEGHLWDGGASTLANGVRFVPNMPTEEVFTAPHRERVDGVVRATMPLSLYGTLIDDFSVEFSGGKVVRAVAGKGQATLDKFLETDEGARRLGEVALVPASSPIARMGLLFYNTLFDENAACHIALGRAYPNCLRGGTEMSEEERSAHGLNDSLTHVDFMIGSAEMDVFGELPDGTLEPVLRKGEWVD